jgi:hypothetical protein
MSITNAEVANMENMTTLCCAMALLNQRLHMKALSSREKHLLDGAVQNLRAIESDIHDRIEVVPARSRWP